MWSFGIVLYELAVGFNPTRVYRRQFTSFLNPNPSVLFECKREWEDKSPLLIDLIMKCLKVVPSERLSAS